MEAADSEGLGERVMAAVSVPMALLDITELRDGVPDVDALLEADTERVPVGELLALRDMIPERVGVLVPLPLLDDLCETEADSVDVPLELADAETEGEMELEPELLAVKESDPDTDELPLVEELTEYTADPVRPSVGVAFPDADASAEMLATLDSMLETVVVLDAVKLREAVGIAVAEGEDRPDIEVVAVTELLLVSAKERLGEPDVVCDLLCRSDDVCVGDTVLLLLVRVL